MNRPSRKVVRNEQCPECLDSGCDNLAVYEDGGTWCFSCNAGQAQKKSKLIKGIHADLKCGLTADTCKFFNIQIGKYNGRIGTGKKSRQCIDEWVMIYPIMSGQTGQDVELVGQKLVAEDKMMIILWDKKIDPLPLTSIEKWTPNEKLFITITEGEKDMASVGQVQGLQYPVVSVPNGAGGALKSITHNLKELMGYKYVVLGFDNDYEGKIATNKCAMFLQESGVNVRVAEWPEKDANELLKNHREDAIRQAIFTAKTIQPAHLVCSNDILDQILEQPKVGIPYRWKSANDAFYGCQMGEIDVIVGANGIGKTELVKDIVFDLLETEGVEAAYFSFEQTPADTARRLIGAKLGVKIWLPGAEWDIEAIKAVSAQIGERVYYADKAGSMDIAELFLSIRYLARAKNKKIFIIDNLRGLDLDEKEKASSFMRTLQTICKDLHIKVFLLSHVAKDKMQKQVYVSLSPKDPFRYDNLTTKDVDTATNKAGLDWENGRMPQKTNIDGHSIIGDLANNIWALARNTTSDDPKESSTLMVKPIKTRLDGAQTGKIFKLCYTSSGRYEEIGYAPVEQPKNIFDNDGGAF